MLQAVLPYTRGKRCLFVGGDPREEKRREIEIALELDDLAWPAVPRKASPSELEPEIAKSDLTALLIRFMGHGFNQSVSLTKRHGVRLIRLPRGLGLRRIVHDFYTQLAAQRVEEIVSA